MTEKTEFCWMIERGDSEVSRPLYWKGTNMGTDPEAWTVDPINGIRFSCQSCAEVVAHNLMGRGETRIRCRVKEHGFG